MSKFLKTNKFQIFVWVGIIGITYLSGYLTYLKSANFLNQIQNKSNKSIHYSIQNNTLTTTSQGIYATDVSNGDLMDDTSISIQTNVNVYTSVNKIDINTSGLAEAEAFSFSSSTFLNQEPSDEKIITVVLKVNQKEYIADIKNGTTVYELMQKLESETDFEFGGVEYDYLGFFVKSIGGTHNNEQGDNKYWMYYVNGEPANIGISHRILKNKDIIEWKYEKDSSLHF